MWGDRCLQVPDAMTIGIARQVRESEVRLPQENGLSGYVQVGETRGTKKIEG
jgi:hypothetical protein